MDKKMESHFHNKAAYQRGQFMSFSKISGSNNILVSIGNYSDKENSQDYQMTREEMIDLIGLLKCYLKDDNQNFDEATIIE